jgi:hypothetical protein
MDRDTLNVFLQSGPARKYDIRRFSIEREGGTPLLFAHNFLNNSILFKCVSDDINLSGHDNSIINTIIYMPYDIRKPEEGGESFVFSVQKFARYVEAKCSSSKLNYAAVEGDAEILRVLNSVPTFSPVILELAFERNNMRLPETYLEMTPELRAKLRAQLKGRIRPLIVAAYQGGGSVGIEKAVNDLTSKLFSLRNVREILPLVNALRLPPENAVETLSSWIGITYFEYEYNQIQSQLKQFSVWIGNYKEFTENLTKRDKEICDGLIKSIRERLSVAWHTVFALSSEYKTSYSKLVYDGDICRFTTFLVRCRDAYWELGDLLGRFEQTAIAWRLFSNACRGRSISVQRLASFFLLLRKLHEGPLQRPDDEFSETGQEQGGFPNFSSNLF